MAAAIRMTPMENYTLISFQNDAELARAAASEFAGLMSRRGPEGPFCVALSGGRIARQFFQELARELPSRGEALDGVHFFWADERCVPPDDPESNYRIARELLFAPLRVAEGQIHRIQGERPPEQAAADAARDLLQTARNRIGGQPVLHLVLLGMGEDGHVASLFPGESEEIAAAPAIYRPVVAAKPPPHRITLGYSVLAAAKEVWVLASGAGKERALAESLAPGGGTPLGKLLRMRSQTRILTDIRKNQR